MLFNYLQLFIDCCYSVFFLFAPNAPFVHGSNSREKMDIKRRHVITVFCWDNTFWKPSLFLGFRKIKNSIGQMQWLCACCKIHPKTTDCLLLVQWLLRESSFEDLTHDSHNGIIIKKYQLFRTCANLQLFCWIFTQVSFLCPFFQWALHPLPFYILQPLKSTPFHIPEAWKRDPFWAEPSHIGHYEE